MLTCLSPSPALTSLIMGKNQNYKYEALPSEEEDALQGLPAPSTIRQTFKWKAHLATFAGAVLLVFLLVATFAPSCLGTYESLSERISSFDSTIPWSFLPGGAEYYSIEEMQALYNLKAENPESKVLMMQLTGHVNKKDWRTLALLDNKRAYAALTGGEYALAGESQSGERGSWRKLEVLLERIEAELERTHEDAMHWI